MAEKIHQLPFLRDQSDLDLRGKLQSLANSTAGYVLQSLPNAAQIIGRFLMGIILTVYFMLEGPEAYQWALAFVPIDKRVRLDAALQRAEVRMGKWLLAQGTLMLILGVCSLIVFGALHLRYYYALALLMGLFNLIPIAGAVVTVGLAMLVAAVDSWGKVLGVAIFYGIYAQVENGYLTPRIMKSSVDLAGLAVIVSFLIGGTFAGVLGAVIAVPSAVLVSVLLDEYFVHHDRHGELES
jgi:predicted PurR-regulated permease PerM